MIRATTETGATYDIRNGMWRHREGEWHKLHDMRNADWDEAIAAQDGGSEQFWNYLRAQPVALMPQIGLALYVSDGNSWRLSSPVVSVKEVEYRDEG